MYNSDLFYNKFYKFIIYIKNARIRKKTFIKKN